MHKFRGGAKNRQIGLRAKINKKLNNNRPTHVVFPKCCSNHLIVTHAVEICYVTLVRECFKGRDFFLCGRNKIQKWQNVENNNRRNMHFE